MAQATCRIRNPRFQGLNALRCNEKWGWKEQVPPSLVPGTVRPTDRSSPRVRRLPPPGVRPSAIIPCRETDRPPTCDPPGSVVPADAGLRTGPDQPAESTSGFQSERDGGGESNPSSLGKTPVRRGPVSLWSQAQESLSEPHVRDRRLEIPEGPLHTTGSRARR